MKKKILYFLLGSIFLLAIILRFYNLGLVPSSLDWDEASLGWNAYSLLKTGTDEYGNRFPVSLRSFNDYKPVGYVYSAILPISLFGLNEFSIRFPSAVAGSLTVLLTYFLVCELTKRGQSKQPNFKLALLTSFLLAISPWHIQFSRVAFETNLSLFFFVGGATLLVSYLNNKKSISLLMALASFVMSIYSYHSARLVVPLFLAGIGLYNWRVILGRPKIIFVSILFLAVALFPIARNTLHVGSLNARFDSVSIFEKGRPISDYPAIIATNYLTHFNFDFLFLTGDLNERHHAPSSGLLYWIEAPFLLIGMFFLFKRRPKWYFFLIWWVLVAPIASSLTRDVPHAVRSLLFLPTFQLITAYGILCVTKIFKLKNIMLILVPVIFMGNTYSYLDNYFIHMPYEFSKSWQYGYKQMVKKVISIEGSYDNVLITTQYDQPYIYFLFYGRISPIIKNNGYFSLGMDKYQFGTYSKDQLLSSEKKTLLVLGNKDNTEGLQILDTVKFPDGSLAFTLATKL